MPTNPFINIILLLMLVIKTAFFGFKGPVGFASLLMLFPFYLCLITVSDSLFSQTGIRSWNKHKGRFEWIGIDEQPVQFWLEILVSWIGATMFGYFYFML